jgi:hypothetical protein
VTFRYAFPLLLALASQGACAIEYSWTGGHARIVDAATKQPIANVAVLATWDSYYEVHDGGKNLKTESARTNASGEFYLPPWGPVEAGSGPRGQFGLLLESPVLIFFKDGYFTIDHNETGFEPDDAFGWRGPAKRIAWFEGLTFRMRKGEQTKRVQAAEVSQLARYVPYSTDPCAWLAYPEWFAALQAKALRLKAEGTITSDEDMPLASELDASKCKDGVQIFQDNLRWFQ